MRDSVSPPTYEPTDEDVARGISGDILRSTPRPCLVHKRHDPASYVNEVHHVWPLGHGGPDVPENTVVVCATGPNNIHKLLSLLLKNKGVVPAEAKGRYTQGERRYARTGYDRIVRKAL